MDTSSGIHCGGTRSQQFAALLFGCDASCGYQIVRLVAHLNSSTTGHDHRFASFQLQTYLLQAGLHVFQDL